MPTAAPRRLPVVRVAALALAARSLLAFAAVDPGAGARHPPLEPPPRTPARVWYVDNTAPEGGDGSLVAPFTSLRRAERAADVGDTLYVFRGDGTSRGLDEGVRLRPYQRLVGSGVALEVPGQEALPAGEPPLLAAREGAVVELADRSGVAGIALGDGGAAVGVRGAGARAVSLRSVRIAGGGSLAIGVELRDVQGAAAGGLEIAGASAHAVLLERSGGVSIHDSRLDHAGDAGAAIAVRDPAGHVELAMLDVHPASGAAIGIDAREGNGTVAVDRVSVRSPAFVGPARSIDDLTASGAGAHSGSSAVAATPSRVTGIDVAASGTAALEVRIDRIVLSASGGRGGVARAGGAARLTLRLAGSGFLGEAPGPEAMAAHAFERADLRLQVAGNDLLGSEVGLFLTAAGDARLAAEVSDNAVPRVPRGRGIAIVLGDRAEAAVGLARNRLAGHRAEALFVALAGASRLALDLRDNQVEAAVQSSLDPIPALLLRASDEARLCLALAGNRVGAGVGGGPPMTLRQAGAAVIAIAGHEPAGARSAAAVVAAGNELASGGVAIEGTLGSSAGLLCPAPGAASPLAAR